MRLDLFDRRYKVYDATRKFLVTIGREAKFTTSELSEFNAGTSDTEFLFEADVLEHLAKIREQALHLRTTQQLLEKPRLSDDELSRYAQAQENDLSWLNDQITEITKTFAPYLGFANVRLRFWPSLKLFRRITDSSSINAIGWETRIASRFAGKGDEDWWPVLRKGHLYGKMSRMRVEVRKRSE